MQNFGSVSLNSIDSPTCDYQNFIIQQKNLMHKIHSQERKLKNFHKHSTPANPHLMSTSFVKRHSSFNSKSDRPRLCSMERLRNSMQATAMCPPVPLISTELPSASKNFKGSSCSENNINRQIKFILFE